MPKVTFIIDGETTVIEFEHGMVPYSNHGKPESFLDVAKHFGVHLEHACGALRMREVTLGRAHRQLIRAGAEHFAERLPLGGASPLQRHRDDAPW